MSERRLAAIMFTDMVGFSALSHEDEALALELLDEHFRLLRPLIPQYTGREIKTIGDAFMVEFASPLQAVRCAMAMQEALRARNATSAQDRQIAVRIGIHVGDVEHRADDVFGDGVNIAARLEQVAEAGGIYVSRQVYDHIHAKLGAPLESIGTPRLKNIQTAVEVYRVVLPWQAGAAAPVRTRAAAAVAPARVAGGRRSIAVLPFANLSPDPENEYFSDGLTEDILTHLARIGCLKVISRTSVMQYKKTEKSLREIGRELGVATILEGGVRKAGNRVRITVQLLDAQTDEHLWAETYDRELTDIFTIQSDVATQIAGALKARVSADEKTRIERRPTENLEAYQRYLRGLHFLNRRTVDSVKAAITCFERAIELDPRYALAHVGLADSHLVLGNSGNFRDRDIHPAAKAAALKALEIDATLGEAYTSLAQVKMNYDWDWVGAEDAFKRAIALSPGYATVHHWYGHFLIFQGRFDEAVIELRQAQELDPLSLIITSGIGLAYYIARRYDQAMGALQDLMEMEPTFSIAHFLQGLVHLSTASYPEAASAFQRAAELVKTPDTVIEAALGYAYARLGDRAGAREIGARLVERYQQAYASPVWIALLYLGLDERPQMFAWLGKAVEERDNWMRLLKAFPLFDEIRGEPEFASLLRKVGWDRR